jgi:hypothetical protein
VVECFRTTLRGFNEDAELIANLLLTDVFVEPPRAKRTLERIFLRALRLALDEAGQLVVFDRHACGPPLT